MRSGARKRCACAELGLTLRTFERWTRNGGIASDTRPMAVHPVPTNTLSAEERAHVLKIANSPRFADLPPTQIVPRLADEGRYLASESTFYRLLRAEKQLTHRGRAEAPQARFVPRRAQPTLCLGYHVLSARYRLPPTIP
ncbi:MAG: helix-turn-helix domain-containing protein [Acidiferrobacter sp.]